MSPIFLYEDQCRLRERIFDGFSSVNITRRLDAILLLTKLDNNESIQILEEIIKGQTNLNMKLEALRILLYVIDSQTYKIDSRILQISLDDGDLEVVRNGLLFIRNISPRFVSESLISSLREKLCSENSDIQYHNHTVIPLMHLRFHIPWEELNRAILPLTMHTHETLNKIAHKAIYELQSVR